METVLDPYQYPRHTGIVTYLPGEQLEASKTLALETAAAYTEYMDPEHCIVIFAETARKAWDEIVPGLIDLLEPSEFFDLDTYSRIALSRFFVMGPEGAYREFIIVEGTDKQTFVRLNGRSVYAALVDESFVGHITEAAIRRSVEESGGRLITFGFKLIDTKFWETEDEQTFMAELCTLRDTFEPTGDITRTPPADSGIKEIRSIPTQGIERPSSDDILSLFT